MFNRTILYSILSCNKLKASSFYIILFGKYFFLLYVKYVALLRYISYNEYFVLKVRFIIRVCGDNLLREVYKNIDSFLCRIEKKQHNEDGDSAACFRLITEDEQNYLQSGSDCHMCSVEKNNNYII